MNEFSPAEHAWPDDGLGELPFTLADVFDATEAQAPPVDLDALVEHATSQAPGVPTDPMTSAKAASGLTKVLGIASVGVTTAALVWALQPPQSPSAPTPTRTQSVSAAPKHSPREPSSPATTPPPTSEYAPPKAEPPPSPTRARARRRAMPQAEVPAPPSMSASDLLRRANDARRAGRNTSALTDYAELLARFPDTRHAQTATVARGRMYLDLMHEPAAAARDFEDYLTRYPKGRLTREARLGLASAYAALGDTARELEAWRSVLRHYPSGPHTSRVHARITELQPPTTTHRD